MSGIMTAIVGTVTASNIIYGAGLYNNVTGVDLSPITGSVNISSGSTSVDQTWIGYFTPASSGTTTLSLQTAAVADDFNDNASTTGQLWFGSGAITGSGPADITATNNQTSSGNFAMTQGVYYPIRIRWTGSYSVGGFLGGAFGSITFLAAGSSNVTNRIFYNTVTNGF
jgi:GLEYA domain